MNKFLLFLTLSLPFQGMAMQRPKALREASPDVQVWVKKALRDNGLNENNYTIKAFNDPNDYVAGYVNSEEPTRIVINEGKGSANSLLFTIYHEVGHIKDEILTKTQTAYSTGYYGAYKKIWHSMVVGIACLGMGLGQLLKERNLPLYEYYFPTPYLKFGANALLFGWSLLGGIATGNFLLKRAGSYAAHLCTLSGEKKADTLAAEQLFKQNMPLPITSKLLSLYLAKNNKKAMKIDRDHGHNSAAEYQNMKELFSRYGYSIKTVKASHFDPNNPEVALIIHKTNEAPIIASTFHENNIEDPYIRYQAPSFKIDLDSKF